MQYDFNALELKASELMDAGNFADAMKIYLLMADGDPSLDAGYLAHRIGRCLELMGDLHSARYWFGRAVEENPAISTYVAARERVESAGIDDLIAREDYEFSKDKARANLNKLIQRAQRTAAPRDGGES